MLVSKYKKIFSLTLFASSLAMLSATTNAASINTILNPNADISVTDLGDDGLTGLEINLSNNNTTGIWLLMDASFSAVDEDFRIKTVSNNASVINNFYFQVVKLEDKEFASFIPTADDWTESLLSNNPFGQTPGVGSVTMDPDNSNSSHRFHMALSPVLPSIQNSAMTLNLNVDDPNTPWPDDKPWLGFNSQRSQFLLNIDWNEVDVNYEPDPEPVPLPPAVLMFGSAMLGLVGFSRRRKVS